MIVACGNCKAENVVRFMMPGDSSKCQSCGSVFSVPEAGNESTVPVARIVTPVEPPRFEVHGTPGAVNPHESREIPWELVTAHHPVMG